jgi:hypothetical protein
VLISFSTASWCSSAHAEHSSPDRNLWIKV